MYKMYKMNMLPIALQRETLIDTKKLVINAGIILTAIIILGSYGLFLIRFLDAKKELTAIRSQLSELQSTVDRAEKIKRERVETEAALNDFNTLLKRQFIWSEMLNAINRSMPADIWLAGIDIHYEGSVAGQTGQNNTQAGAPVDQQKNDTTTASEENNSNTSGALNIAGSVKTPGDEKQAELSMPVPNTVVFKGFSHTVPAVGVFINNLSRLSYFSDFKLKKLSEKDEGLSFEISAVLKSEGES